MNITEEELLCFEAECIATLLENVIRDDRAGNLAKAFRRNSFLIYFTVRRVNSTTIYQYCQLLVGLIDYFIGKIFLN